MVGFATLSAQAPEASPAAHQQLIPAGARILAPDFSLRDVFDRQISLSGYKGRVVLLDFWATTYGGCKVELPWYIEFNERYGTKGLSLIGLDMYGESPEVVRPFMAKWHMRYPVAIGTDALGERFGLKAMPLTVLIDRNGRVALSHAGIVDRTAFEQDIRQLLQE